MTDDERTAAHARILELCENALQIIDAYQTKRKEERRETEARRKMLWQRLIFLSGATASTDTASAGDLVYGDSNDHKDGQF